MWGRRSTTRTRLFSCVAIRSAIVRPKNPEPTTKRSYRPGECAATRGEGAVIGSKGIRPGGRDPGCVAARGAGGGKKRGGWREGAGRGGGKECAYGSQVAIRSRFRIVTPDSLTTSVPSTTSVLTDQMVTAGRPKHET